MQIKEIHPITFLYYRTETTVDQLSHHLPVAQQLYQEAVQQAFTITGPVHWHYFDFTGNNSKSFRLEIALPIAQISSEYDGPFHIKRTELFRCLSFVHEGSWSTIPESYGKMMAHVRENGLQLQSVNREIYINTDWHHPEGNVTEIQFGIIK
jgi:effector-binding domain-containing protein